MQFDIKSRRNFLTGFFLFLHISTYLYIFGKIFYNMETILFILIAYLVGVAIYTVVIKNNAMNKYNPQVKISDIVKEGLRKMGIGFLITGLIIAAIVMALHLLN